MSKRNDCNNSKNLAFYSEVVSLVNSATDFVKNIQPKKLLPSSGKLKREVSMEEIIQVLIVGKAPCKVQTNFSPDVSKSGKMSQVITMNPILRFAVIYHPTFLAPLGLKLAVPWLFVLSRNKL